MSAVVTLGLIVAGLGFALLLFMLVINRRLDTRRVIVNGKLSEGVSYVRAIQHDFNTRHVRVDAWLVLADGRWVNEPLLYTMYDENVVHVTITGSLKPDQRLEIVVSRVR